MPMRRRVGGPAIAHEQGAWPLPPRKMHESLRASLTNYYARRSGRLNGREGMAERLKTWRTRGRAGVPLCRSFRMNPRPSFPLPVFALAWGLASVLACVPACRHEVELPEAAYREAVSAFYTGLAALQTSQEVLARQKLERVIEIAPAEPAGWANLGLLLMRQQEIDEAAVKLAKAAELAPRSAPIERLLALAESRRGKLPEAIAPLEAGARRSTRAT